MIVLFSRSTRDLIGRDKGEAPNLFGAKFRVLKKNEESSLIIPENAGNFVFKDQV